MDSNRGSRPTLERLEDRLVPATDMVLEWNAIMLDANAVDHGLAQPDQAGPTRTAYAFAIVSAAMFDALNSIEQTNTPYAVLCPEFAAANPDAAVAAAAYYTLRVLYPQQQARFAVEFHESLDKVENGQGELAGCKLGQTVAKEILALRVDDGSDVAGSFDPLPLPGYHQPDPLHPNQGFVTPAWGSVTPFVLPNVEDFGPPPPPPLGSTAYARAYNEVRRFGGDGVHTPTQRTEDQTQIGLYWAYDGTPGLGTPPRLYNQIAAAVAEQEGNTMAENARMFALINLAMADAGIQCWNTKYQDTFWRPIVGVRQGDSDGNRFTTADPDWQPLGAPCSNCPPGTQPLNFTPGFPAYTSGHATFGATVFRTLANFYGTDDITFTFTSDELNGVTLDQDGSVRPLAPRTFHSFSEATAENAQSRIYLGIHWQFDARQGVACGTRIADYVFQNALRPLP